jgi:hypothetical protein
MTRATTSSRLKGIRADSPRTNYSGGVRSTGFSTGVAKKELGIANLVVEKAAKLDRGTSGVAVGQGPWQRRLEEVGGTKPLVFCQFGEMGPGLEAPLLVSVAKRGRSSWGAGYASTGAGVVVWESHADTAPGWGLWGTGPCSFGGEAALLGL